jgi:two-component system, cell cycle response regulator DivK
VATKPIKTRRSDRRLYGADRREARLSLLAAGDERPLVLVVDDDLDARTIYSTYMRAMGCDVFTADDGRPAIDKAVDLLPDIIVMDLAMPRVNGWEAIRRLRESSWTQLIPIIAVSAVPVSRDTAFESGCDAYLTKPCEPLVLWSQIRALLRLPSRVLGG